MSNKFQLPSALFTNAADAPFELKLEEGQGFALITEAREDEVVVSVNIPGVAVVVPKQGIAGAFAVGNALIFTLEGDLVAVAVNPDIVEVATESLEEPAPVNTERKPKPRKGSGVRAQGCARGNKLDGASM